MVSHLQRANDGHRSFYDWEWLRLHTYYKSDHPLEETIKLNLWGKEIGDQPPTVTYEGVMASEVGVKDWTALIRRYGFCYVDGCPPTPSATQALLERIAFIRTTHYGGFWDFTSDLSSKDTAYTSLALGAHTDTTYFTDPCGLQMFHLLSHTDGEGGASLLVDGFKAAATLKDEAPEAYHILSTAPIPAHASGNQSISLRPVRAFPVLNHDSGMGPLMQVRWNNDDRGTLGGDQVKIEAWYGAARKWAAILRRESNEYWEQLRPGKPLIFDNWRVLHGRSAFTGKRRMCGGYINHDDFISRYRITNLGRDEVLKRV
ncbi:hypothetical protein MMC08_004930 [Hypocenomyce scalaris]|nr:hypothetical protein [Hypocenomyce scalaris]